jgi:F-type H+-transporting ATPase subunit alpha
VPAQIAILLALTAGLFDDVPMDKMAAAEHAVQEAAAKVPTQISARFDSATKLTDEDRKTIIEIAREALASFQTTPPGPTSPTAADQSKRNPAVVQEK